MPHSGLRAVFVVDDDPLVREATKVWVTSAGYHAETFADPLEFLEALPVLAPGCILLDMHMPGADGLAVLRQITPFLASHPVIVITGHGDVATAVQTMKQGAFDFLEKPFRRPELLEALDAAFQTLPTLSDRGSQAPAPDELISALSAREFDVLQGLMEGLSNKALADKLGLSPRTVEMHRANMMRRLGVRTLSDALKIGFSAEMRTQG